MANQQMESSRFTCCFGPFRTNVEKGAFIIAIVGATLDLVQAIYNFLPTNGTHHQNITSAELCIHFALVHLSIIVAQLKRDPSYYLPYLIIMGINLVQGVAFCLGKMATSQPPDRLWLALFVISMLIALNGWFYSIVYRAYKFMKEQQGQISEEEASEQQQAPAKQTV